MRKIFLAVAAMAMLATACTKDDAVSGGNESLVSFTIDSPELQTRYGEGVSTNRLVYAFYDEAGNHLPDLNGSVENYKTEATIKVYLVEGRKYQAIFWADNANAGYDVNFAEKTMTIGDTTLDGNSEEYDAFYNYTLNIDPAEKTHRIELRRPFAQINIATKDTADAKAAGVEVKATKVSVEAYKTLKFETETNAAGEVVSVANVSDKETFTYDWASKAEGKVLTDYDMLSMNYVLVNERELVDVSLRMSEDETQTADNAATDIVRNYTTVPVQRNYRTYIVGNLLTTTNEFEVETKPGFDGEYPQTDIEKFIMDVQTVGGEFTLPSDITLDGTLVIRKDVVLNLNGKTLTNKVNNAATDVIVVEEGATLTIKGDGVVEAVSGNDGYAVISEGTVVIKGGTYKAGVDVDGATNAVVYARGKGKVYVNGGNFPNDNNSGFVLNKKDADRETTVIEVKGGTFTNFDPANNAAEGAGTNFCAEGFASYDNGDDTYTVLPALTAALKNVTTDTTVEVTTDMHVAAGTTPHTHNATANITINGNGHSVISTAESVDDFQWEGGTIPAMSTIFSSVKGSNAKVIVNDLTFEGTMSALMLGHYVDSSSNWYNTELNNVNVVNTEVVSFSANVSPAVCVYGTAVLNNCNIYGTTLSELDTDPMWPVYDVAAVNYSNVTVNGGKIGSFYMWNQAGVTIADGAEVETVVVRGNMNATKYGLTIKAGAKVGAIDLSAIADKKRVNITIEDGATVGKVVANGVEYASVEDFKNTVPVATDAALADALNNGSTTVVLAKGDYTFPASSIKAGVTIKCEEGTVFTGNSKLNINGATVEGATFSNPSGTAVDQTINGTFKNCTFTGNNGLRWAYAGETVVFEDCVFDGSVYGVHFDGGANDIIFRNCTISGFNALGGAVTMVTFEGCTFVGNGKSSYNGANLWGSAKMIGCEFTFDGTTANEWIDCIGADKTYEFENCTINGVDYTADNYAEYLNYIESRNDITVKINGVDCAM